MSRLYPFYFFLFIFIYPLEAKLLKVDVSAKGAILLNADSGAILYEKESHLPLYPASTTKIATALYALEKMRDRLDEPISGYPDALALFSRGSYSEKEPPYRLSEDGSHIGIKVGEVLPFRALVYGLLIASGNDAANVIAHHVSGSVSQFMDELNAYLREKGLKESIFYNPHGYHYPSHITTAHDLAKITKFALQDPFFREVVKTVHYERPKTRHQSASQLTQTNRLLRKGPFYYSKAIGVKTGYTSAAGHSLVAAAEDKGRRLIAVLLGCPGADHKYRDAIALFEAAFAETKMTRKLFTKAYDQFSLTLKGGVNPLEAVLSDDLSIAYFPAEEPEIKAFLKWDKLAPPIAQGQKVGEIQIMTQENEILKSASLFAKKEVKITFFASLQSLYQTHKRMLFLSLGGSILLVGLILRWWASSKKSAKERS